MKRFAVSIVLLALVSATQGAQDFEYDGMNQVLAVVNGQAITYQEIVGDTEMQAEINARRAVFGIDDSISDRQIEEALVFERLRGFVLQRLLDAEAARAKLQISDTQMRAVLQRERRALGIADDDTRAWARYLKERFNLSPTEYRERRRREILRGETMRYMAGVYGPLPPQFPLEIYFDLSITPRDVRREFERDRPRYRTPVNVRYQTFRLLWPAEMGMSPDRDKLIEAVYGTENSVYYRVQRRGESLQAASAGLRTLIDELKLPRVRLEIPDDVLFAPDDTNLDAMTTQMILQTPSSGGVSEPGSVTETDADGHEYEGIMFVQVFSRQDGDLKVFEDPKVQQGIRERLFMRRYNENQQKVERELMRRAAIVPERLFRR
jgi:hypothetical protein